MKNISKESLISPLAKIDKRATLVGNCIVEDGAVIFGECYLENAIIRKNAIVRSSYISNSEIGQETTVGPFANIKANSKISNNCRIGNFVEIKNSTLGSWTKAAHLVYIGDAEVGERVNIGCGVVFANYDGKNKHRCKVGNDVFIGCNCNLLHRAKLETTALLRLEQRLRKIFQTARFQLDGKKISLLKIRKNKEKNSNFCCFFLIIFGVTPKKL